ncbi:MAG TPA: DUF222 domain-containing protein, partial [Actinopolymorphaceae bacterium]|nr:DUF222 domain-containing protein [Actinopolymorphaceae bacterium]
MVSTTDNPTAGTGTRQHPITVLLDRMRARLGEESGTGLWSMSAEQVADSLRAADGLAAQLASVRLAVVREADRQDVAKAAGATSTANWLAGLLRLRPQEASRSVKLARELEAVLPLTELSLRAGEISVDHAQVIANAVRDMPVEAGPQIRAEAEQVL